MKIYTSLKCFSVQLVIFLNLYFELLGCLGLKLHILTLFRVKLTPFFLQIYFILVEISLDVEFQPSKML